MSYLMGASLRNHLITLVIFGVLATACGEEENDDFDPSELGRLALLTLPPQPPQSLLQACQQRPLQSCQHFWAAAAATVRDYRSHLRLSP